MGEQNINKKNAGEFVSQSFGHVWIHQKKLDLCIDVCTEMMKINLIHKRNNNCSMLCLFSILLSVSKRGKGQGISFTGGCGQ